jgi:hypothetical protein
MLCPGQIYRSSMTVGDGTVAPSSASLVVTRPDGTTTVIGPAVGSFGVEDPGFPGALHYDYLLADVGLHQFGWTTTGPGTAPPPNFVSVRRFASIVSFEEMKEHLNKNRLRTDDDAELARFMMASTELVEDRVGTCVPRVFTDRIDVSSPAMLPLSLVLPRRPLLAVTSVTSVWAGGPVWADPGDGTILAADSEAGIIYQPSGFAFWQGPWDVVSRAGRAEIPERWVNAAKEQCRHLWETQRGAQPPVVLANEETFTSTTGFSFSIPRRVLELLETDMVPSS